MDEKHASKVWIGEIEEDDAVFIHAMVQGDDGDKSTSRELQDAMKDISNVERVCNEYQSHVRYANRLMIANTINCILGIVVMIATTMIGCNHLLFYPERVETLQYVIFAEVGVFIIIPVYTMFQWIIGKLAERTSQ